MSFCTSKLVQNFVGADGTDSGCPWRKLPIKSFVIGHKNFLFANTPIRVKGSVAIYSLIETAKETGLDPYHYLVWVLEQVPRLSKEDSRSFETNYR